MTLEDESRTAGVVGPIIAGRRGWAFGAPLDEVAKARYVTEEFFIEGDARAYSFEAGVEPTTDGRWSVRSYAAAPYRTRMVVVRPRDADWFNGVVFVNWQNVTLGFDAGTPQHHTLAAGCVWVGVSAQRVAIEGHPGAEPQALRGWDPDRYGSLHHPGDDFSFDIFTQAARAVGPHRSTQPVDPLGGLAVRKVLGAGASQSAMRLRAYINAFQPIERAFDGFFLLTDFGVASVPDTRAAERGDALGIPPTVSVQVRDDLGVPVMVLNSEAEVVRTFPVRQPDSENFRYWEVAGVTHSSGVDPALRLAVMARDGVGTQHGSGREGGHPPDANTLSFVPVHKAALQHMHTWLLTGRPPPVQPRVEVDPGPPQVIRRDPAGNAVGGIRVPDMAVPTGAHDGYRTEDHLLNALIGTTVPFTVEQLRARYPDRATFIDTYETAVRNGLAAGYLLEDDAAALTAQGVEIAQRTITW